MSDLWQELYEGKAFKPKPSLWELADAHVPFTELGLDAPPEPRLIQAVREGDGVALLLGESGAGKSSVLAALAQSLADEETDSAPARRFMPVFVPVSARGEASRELDAFGRQAISEVSSALAALSSLGTQLRTRLRLAAARDVSVQLVPRSFSAKLTAKLFGTVGSEIGVAFAREIATISGERGLDAYGGIQTLGQVADARGLELVIIIEDTDAFVADADEGEGAAEAFLGSVVLPLSSDVDVAVIVAVQPRWMTSGAYSQVADRAVSVVHMPALGASQTKAEEVLRAVLAQRARRGASDPARIDDQAAVLFTGEAITALAERLRATRSLRSPLAWLRDALEFHGDNLRLSSSFGGDASGGMLGLSRRFGPLQSSRWLRTS